MKEIVLSLGKVASVDDEDFEYLNQWKWSTLNYKGLYYAMRIEKKKCYYMHRLIMNTPKGLVTDHIDHNGLNNQKSNLRVCTRRENTIYCRKSIDKIRGVSKTKNTIFAHIMVNRKNIYLGSFKTIEEAKNAYNVAAIRYFGEFAILN